jgi:hypothetical protein
MPKDFVPPADDLDSYVKLDSFATEIIDELQNDKEDEQKLFDSADIIVKGTTNWTFEEDCDGDLMIIDNRDNTLYLTLEGTNWNRATYANKTFLKKK